MNVTNDPRYDEIFRLISEWRPGVVRQLQARGVKNAEDIFQETVVGLIKNFNLAVGPIEPFFQRLLPRRINDSLRKHYKAVPTIPLENSGVDEIADKHDGRADDWLEVLRFIVEHIRTDAFELLFEYHVREVKIATLATRYSVTKDAIKVRLWRLRKEARALLVSLGLRRFEDVYALRGTMFSPCRIA